MHTILKTLAAVAFIAGPAVVSAEPIMRNTGFNGHVAATLPNGMQFEAGLTPEQQVRVAELVNSSGDTVQAFSRRGAACPRRDACKAVACHFPFVGLACLACQAVPCNRRRDVGEGIPAGQETANFFPAIYEAMQAEVSLAPEQKILFAQALAANAMVPTESNSVRRASDSCAAKTACYASVCPIPFLGLACLACSNVKCP